VATTEDTVAMLEPQPFSSPAPPGWGPFTLPHGHGRDAVQATLHRPASASLSRDRTPLPRRSASACSLRLAKTMESPRREPSASPFQIHPNNLVNATARTMPASTTSTKITALPPPALTVPKPLTSGP
jgi:hypothetical protein